MNPVLHSARTNGTQKVFIPLENNPEVMTKLAHTLGLDNSLQFHDLYSLTDPDLLALVPRPAQALLFIYPCTPTSEAYFARENATDKDYQGSGPNEPVLFYHQTIVNACGLFGLLHCTTNGVARSLIKPDSALAQLMQDVTPLTRDDRSVYLHDSEVLERAHDIAAHTGDTEAPARGDCPDQAFVAFVKGTDGHLYELEGRRKGPVDRGALDDDEDVLSEKALRLGPLPYVDRELQANRSGMVNANENENLMFSCTVLA